MRRSPRLAQLAVGDTRPRIAGLYHRGIGPQGRRRPVPGLTPGGGFPKIRAVRATSNRNRHRWPAGLLLPLVLGLSLGAGIGVPRVVRAQSTATAEPIGPPPTRAPEPSQAPPVTEPPPATSAAGSTPAPVPSGRPAPASADDEDAPPPAPVLAPAATPDLLPTRTRRPTRTPRTTPTISPTPPVAGGLRLTLLSEPAQPILRERVSFVVELRNQSGRDLRELTLDIGVPDVLLDFGVETRVGETARAGQLLRWYLPELPRDSGTSLRLSGMVARSGGGRTQLCALLLSAGAPLEHCSAFEVLSAPAAAPLGAGTPTPDPGGLPTAEPAGDLLHEAPRALASGWGLLLLGLGILGAWLGLQLRSRAASDAAGSAGAEPAAEGPDPADRSG